jgi:hypothetical protein
MIVRLQADADVLVVHHSVFQARRCLLRRADPVSVAIKL